MQIPTNSGIGLTIGGCQRRQQRLIELLEHMNLEGVLICNPLHVYYFTGYWTASYHASLLFVVADESHLVMPVAADAATFVAAKASVYQSHRLATLIENQFRAALRPIENQITS